MSAKRKTDSRLLENADLRERPWLLARVTAVGRLARRLVGRRRYARREVAPFRAYGSPHS
ncbi:hypothetical protein [Streptomyces sp. NPDC047042]|uniref:hypothetical protein n=1 Tax=Streptomyces sp. NPDC047042 TaxID=3154807 RepID=UPI0034039C39